MAKKTGKSSSKGKAKQSAESTGQTSAPVADSDLAMVPAKEKTTMTLTLKGLDKRGRNAIFTGAAVALRFPIGAFPNKRAPQTLELLGDALAGPKQKLTPEERKAQRAAAPKLTLAEKIAKREEQLAKLRAKAQAAQAQPDQAQAAQPAL